MSLLKVHYLLCELVAIEKGIKAEGGLFIEIVQATPARYSPEHAAKGLARAGNTSLGESQHAGLMRVVFLDSVLGLSCLEVPYTLL